MTHPWASLLAMEVVRNTISASEAFFAYASTDQRLAANLRAIRMIDRGVADLSGQALRPTHTVKLSGTTRWQLFRSTRHLSEVWKLSFGVG
jgi:hypothetical protein